MSNWFFLWAWRDGVMRRIPDARKALSSTLRRDRVRRPRLPSGAPHPRRGLSPLERARFVRLVQLLGARAGAVDVVILELTACALARHDQASAVLAKRGVSYEAKTTAGGTLQRRRPEVDIAADAWRRACRGLVELGLTPMAEQKLDVDALTRKAHEATLADYRARRRTDTPLSRDQRELQRRRAGRLRGAERIVPMPKEALGGRATEQESTS
jgi:phage terminase small subunit